MKKFAILLTVCLMVASASAASAVVYENQFNHYAAGQKLYNQGVGFASELQFYSQDSGKANTDDFYGTGLGTIKCNGGTGSQDDASLVWEDVTGGPNMITATNGGIAYLHFDMTVNAAAGGRIRLRTKKDGWGSNYIQFGAGDFAGLYKITVGGSGTAVTDNLVLGQKEDFLMVMDIVNMKWRLYLGKTIADIGNLGTPVAEVTAHSSGANVAGFGIIEWGSWAGLEIDSIMVATPEPATMALLGIGGVLTLVRRRR